MSGDPLEDIAQAAIDGATASFAGREYAIVVVVRELGGGRITTASNVMGGKPTIIRTLEETASALRGGSLIIS